jgi:hypothetical protein
VPDPQLRAFADEVGFAPDFVAADAAGTQPLKGRNLELKIKASGSTFDIVTVAHSFSEGSSTITAILFSS